VRLDEVEQLEPARSAVEIDLLDELPEDPAPQPQRLAGVGAALGSCFSVMFVVLAIGSVGSLSGPRSGLADEPPRDETFLIQPGPANEKLTLPYADAVRLQSLDRAAMLARAEVQAAESRLALLRTQIHNRALEQAEQAREKAVQIESQGSPYDWISSEHLAARTLDRAKARLEDDLTALDHMRQAAEADLERLRDAAATAELAAAQARVEVVLLPTGPSSAETSANPFSDSAPSPFPSGNPAVGDLRPLIARHHACLLDPAEPAAARD